MISGFNIQIRVGSIEAQRAPKVQILSQRNHPLTLITVVLPDPQGEICRLIRDRDPMAIVMGYRNQAAAQWSGSVLGGPESRGKDQVVINGIGPERVLVETLIKQSFYQETPESIVRFAIGQAGLQAGKIEPIGMMFPRFIASNIPVWQVARQCEATCHRAYGMDMRSRTFWMGRDGRVNWGNFCESADMPVIESQANLISHSPGESTAGLSRVETFMLPHMMHSMKFRLKDFRRGIEGIFKAEKVMHRFGDNQPRTFISYGAENERY